MFRSISFLITFVFSASATEIRLDQISARVRTHHPMLKAARLAIEEARGRQLSSGRLANPVLESSFQNESRTSPRTMLFAIDQSFPLTRRLSLEKQLSQQLVHAAQLEVRDKERHLLADAQALAIQILALDQQRELRQKQRELAQKFADFTQDRATKGELSPLDAGQAQVDARRLILEAQKLETQRTSLLGVLKPMLGISPHDTLSLRGGLPALALPARLPWQRRADYQLAQTKVTAAQTDADLAKSKRLQDVSAGFFASRENQGQPDGRREDTGFIGFRFSIPLPLWNRNQGEIAEKKAIAERQRLEVEALGKQIASEADTALREMQANADLANETRQSLLPLVTEQTAKLEKAYETGQTDLLSVLRARDQRLQLESATLDAERDFHLARVRYEAATGAHLP